MKNWTTQNGYKIFKITRLLACYLVLKGNFCLLVDSGHKRSFSRILKRIMRILGNQKSIDYLVLTHTHYDHSQNAAALQQHFHYKVIVHQNESDWLKKGFTPLPRGTFFLSDHLTAMGNKYVTHKYSYEPVEDFITITDAFDFGKDINIKLACTPGHTAGSVTVVVDDEIALAGDALFGQLRKSIYPPFADDRIELVRSWGLLLQTGCRLFLPGHGSEVKRSRLRTQYNLFRDRFPEGVI